MRERMLIVAGAHQHESRASLTFERDVLQMAIELLRQGDSLSQAALATASSRHQDAKALQQIRDSMKQPNLDPSSLDALRQMERRHAVSVQKLEDKREQLRVEWQCVLPSLQSQAFAFLP